MKLAVVDTSALVRLYVPDGRLPDGFEEFVDAAWRSEGILVAPELILAEAGQVLRKKEHAGYLKPEEVDEILDSILMLPLDLASHSDLITDAVDISRKQGLTVYDSIFIALAVKRGGLLYTADEELAKAFTKMSCG